MVRIRKSVSITKEQSDFIDKHRYSPSILLQERIEELMVDHLENMCSHLPTLLESKHNETLEKSN